MSLAILPFMHRTAGETRDGANKAKSKRQVEEKYWMQIGDEQNLASTSSTAFQLVVLDHLLFTREIEAARVFVQEVGGFGRDLDIDWSAHEERRGLVRSLEERRISELLEALSTRLDAGMEESLFFELHLLQFGRIVSTGNLQEALDYAEKTLSPIAERATRFSERMEEHMILLLSIDPSLQAQHAQRVARNAVEEFEERTQAYDKAKVLLNNALLRLAKCSEISYLDVLCNQLTWAEASLESSLEFQRFR